MADPNWAPMTEKARANLQRHRQSLIEDLDVEMIVDELIADSALVPDEVELISSKATRRRRAVTFLNLISTKGQHAYNSTHSVLVNSQPHLALFLEDAITGKGHLVKGSSLDGFTKAQADVLLRLGGVPVPPAVFTPRPQHIEAIKQALKKLAEEPGWVVVHGMGGIGKSVLAAAAIRDPDLLSEYFPGGPFWLSVGHIDKTKLLLKVQNLCARLDDDGVRTPPHNLEEGKDRLRKLLLEKHSRSLLILDDVWSSRVIHTFDVQARIMVTTRDRSVTDRVFGPVHRVPLESGFSEEQALRTLATWTHREVENLPQEAKEIYQSSKGSPLVISIIGALLADHPHRWKFYLDKLMRKRYSSLKKVTAYEYGSVGEAMGISLEQLPSELRDVYASFCIFSEDVPIPATVLGVMHDEEQESIEDMMEEIVNKSLAFQEWNTTLKCMVYTLHDLQLDFLTEQYKSSVQGFHKKLVHAFKNQCDGAYHNLPDDSYIHMYLAHHMAQAGEFAELSTILQNLRWIARKITLTGPANMLSDYVSYSGNIPEKQRQIVEEFQVFVSVNAHLLMQTPLPDLLQLALLQQDSTEVCQQARRLVQEKQGGFYVEWCNKYLVRDSLLLTNTPHSGVTMSAHFSPTGDHIISCGEDGTVKLWSSQSAKLVFCLEAHNNWVNWCEICPAGELMVTCSSANVKLWKVKDQSLIKKISGDWLRALISHDGKKVVMCSVEGLIEIIDLEYDRRVMIRGHKEIVRSLAFSPDDAYVISCSDDMTVKVLDSSTGKVMATYEGHEYPPISCTCSVDGQLVASAGGSEVHVWGMLSSQLEGKCVSEADSVLCCEFSPKGDVLAGGLSTFEILLWETKRFKPVAVLKGHTSWVMSVKFDVKGDRLVSASDDETVRIWKVQYGHMDTKSVWKRDFVASFCDGKKRLKFLIAGDNKNRCLMTDGRDMEKTAELSQESSRMRAFALNNDDTKVAYGSDAGTVRVIDLEGQRLERSLDDAHSKEVRWCGFTKKGSTLVTSSNDGLIKIWSEDGKVIECKGHSEGVTSCQIFQDDCKLLSSSHDGTLRVWDLKSGSNLKTVNAHDDWIFMCQLSPDQSMVATVSVDKTAKVWDVASLTLMKSLENHIDSVRTCRFSPDNSILATGDDSGITRVWNIASGQEIGTCLQHKSWVTDIKFSPDSRIVITAGENVRWWQMDGTPLQTFHVRGSFIRQVQISPDFQTFVTIDSAGILYLMCRVRAPQEDSRQSGEVVIV